MEQHQYTIAAHDSPIHFPDINHHSPDVLDITLIKVKNIQYNTQNLNELSSDYNPIQLDRSNHTKRARPTIYTQYITN